MGRPMKRGGGLWRELWVVVAEFKFKLHIQIQTSLGRHSLVRCLGDVARWNDEVASKLVIPWSMHLAILT